MTHRFTDDDVFKVLPTKRPRRLDPDQLIPARYFKDGVIELLIALNFDLKNIMSAHYTDILDKFSEVLDARIKECSKGKSDAIANRCYMTNSSFESFDWRSVVFNAMDIKADGIAIDFVECQYFIVSDNNLIVIKDIERDYYVNYPLPQLEMPGHNGTSLHCFSNYKHDVDKRLEYARNIIADLSCIENLLGLSRQDKKKWAMSSEEQIKTYANISLNELLDLKDSLLSHLHEYASGFGVDLILA